MKSNYHSHTLYCGHASGLPKDYIKNAIASGYDIYGISDHGFLPDSILKRLFEYPWLKYQMNYGDFENYLKGIDEAQALYGHQIKIYKALEMEYVEGEDKFYRDVLKRLDYLILGVHFCLTPDNKIMGTRGINDKASVQIYVDTAIKAMETGYYKIFAHPDIFLYGYEKFDQVCLDATKSLIESSIKNNVYLELNCGGIRKGLKPGSSDYYYPRKEFWRVVKEYKDALTIINLDTHNPSEIMGDSFIVGKQYLDDLEVNYEDFVKTIK